MKSRNQFIVGLVLSVSACGGETPPAPPAQPVAMPVGTGVGAAVPAIPAVGNGIQLSPGFQPDPHTVTGQAGGTVNATTLNQSCRGWIAAAPNHILAAQSNFGNLRFVVNGGNADTTLVVQHPNGTYSCADDDDGGRNPILNVGITPGLHKIWIGTYNVGEPASYTLALTENIAFMPTQLGPVPPPSGAVAAPSAGASGLDLTGNAGNFQPLVLNPGFMPDPSVVRGTSGGGIDASSLGSGCRGHIAARPDHLFTASGNFSNLRILVNSNSDTTLVVQTPSGAFLCNDDAEGTNPIVAGQFPAGQYRIWVGSYSAGQQAAYQLGVTELSSTTAASLR